MARKTSKFAEMPPDEKTRVWRDALDFSSYVPLRCIRNRAAVKFLRQLHPSDRESAMQTLNPRFDEKDRRDIRRELALIEARS